MSGRERLQGLRFRKARQDLRSAVAQFARTGTPERVPAQLSSTTQKILDILLSSWCYSPGDIRDMLFPWCEIGKARYQVVALCLDDVWHEYAPASLATWQIATGYASPYEGHLGQWLPALVRNDKVYVFSMRPFRRYEGSPEVCLGRRSPHLFRGDKDFATWGSLDRLELVDTSDVVALAEELDDLVEHLGWPGYVSLEKSLAELERRWRRYEAAVGEDDAWWLRAPLLAHPQGQVMVRFSSVPPRGIALALASVPSEHFLPYGYKKVAPSTPRTHGRYVLPYQADDEWWRELLSKSVDPAMIDDLPDFVREAIGW